VKTINGEQQLQALVDGKKIVVTEASVRRDLQLDDEEGTDCLHKAIIFEELTRMGAKNTAWNEFSSTMDSAIMCLTTNQKFNFSKYIFESMVPQSSVPSDTTNVADKAVNEEPCMQLKELMDFYTKLQQRVLDLEKTKTSQAQEITSLKKRVKKLEKKGGSRTHKLRRLYKVGRSARVVSSDEASLGDQEDASKQGRKIHDIDANEDITLENVHDAEMFDVNDLHSDEVFVEKEVPVKEVSVVGKVNTASIATTVSAAIIIEDEITLAQVLAELKRKGIKVKKSKNDQNRQETEKTSDQVQERDLKPILKAGSRPWSRKDKKVKKRTKEMTIIPFEEDAKLLKYPLGSSTPFGSQKPNKEPKLKAHF
ncbi:hypothetical protein Tco_1013986, partial [Tanacetum coccineum]